jgi:hypothetical protein
MDWLNDWLGSLSHRLGRLNGWLGLLSHRLGWLNDWLGSPNHWLALPKRLVSCKKYQPVRIN